MLTKRAEALIQRAIHEASKAPTFSDARAIRAELESDLEAIGPQSAVDGLRVFDALLAQHTKHLTLKFNTGRRGATASAFRGETALRSFDILLPMSKKRGEAESAGRKNDDRRLLDIMDSAVRECLRAAPLSSYAPDQFRSSLNLLVSAFRSAGGKADRSVTGHVESIIGQLFEPPPQIAAAARKVIALSPTVRKRVVANPSPKMKRRKHKSRKHKR